MPLDLTDIDGQIQRITTAHDEERYRVLPNHAGYSWLNHMCLSLSAMTSAITAIRGLNVGQGDYIGLTCIALDYVLSIPVSGCVACALRNETPGFIEIVSRQGRRPESLEILAAPLRAWMHNIIWPGFIHFFETNELHFRSPDLKLIVNELRNAYAHGGTLRWPDQRPPANWHGISLNKSVRNKRVEDVLGYSDVLALMLLVSNEISVTQTAA